MSYEVDDTAIEKEIRNRQYEVHINANWFTPSGKQRSAPMYEATIRNDFLGKARTLKSQSPHDIETKAREQITRWAEQERRQRLRAAHQDATTRAESDTESMAQQAHARIQELASILANTLAVDDRIDWAILEDKADFPLFDWPEPSPPRPAEPTKLPDPAKSAWEWLLPSLKRKRLEDKERISRQWEALRNEQIAKWQRSVADWEQRKSDAMKTHEKHKSAFYQEQERRNDAVREFRSRFENGEEEAVVEYLIRVFERSEYPAGFAVSHDVAYDVPSKTAVVELTLPSPDEVSDISDYKFVKSKREAKAVHLKKKEHEALYDRAVKETILRTVHEALEAVYTEHVMAVVVNGWVTFVDKATGQDKTSCTISLRADREAFEQINLARIDPSECIKSLKGLIAGPLSQVAPVQPVLQLNREDRRFVESQEVLAEINSTTNLAAMDWEAFEHLVRELFDQMFSAQGAEVKVTQASRDGGVDAIAFDPHPIRGGKFVIQAKRYTNIVPVSAVRDLYGTVVNEGASRGILVTTAYYGRDARAFAQDKPLTLIDGPNLVHLLEEHGHKVRIDIQAARRERNTHSEASSNPS